MPGTQITQTRQPVVIDAGTRYQISATCAFAGTLPSVHIFTRQVIQDDDPKNDIFLRVASVTDFTDYGEDRQASITDGDFLYRASTVVQLYDNVTTATGAWDELSSRINTLVEEYDVYINAFLTPVDGSVVTYPTVDPSTKAALISAYSASLTTVTTAEQARDTENIACQAVLLELQTRQQQLVEVQQDIATISPIVTAANVAAPSLDSIQNAIVVNNTNASTAVQLSAATTGEQNAILASLSATTAQLAALGQTSNSVEVDIRVPLAGFLGSLQTRAAGYQADVTALNSEYAECMREMAALQAAVDQARAQRDADLAAIRAICPDFNPATDL